MIVAEETVLPLCKLSLITVDDWFVEKPVTVPGSPLHNKELGTLGERLTLGLNPLHTVVKAAALTVGNGLTVTVTNPDPTQLPAVDVIKTL